MRAYVLVCAAEQMNDQVRSSVLTATGILLSEKELQVLMNELDKDGALAAKHCNPGH